MITHTQRVVRIMFLNLCITGSSLISAQDTAPAEIPTGQTHFHLVVPSYNTEKWCGDNLASIASQQYPRDLWHATIIIDASTDNSPALIQSYIAEHKLESLITVIQNPFNLGAMANIYHAVWDTPDDEVIVMLDGDDQLASPLVLAFLDQVYQKYDVWLTFGSYREWPSGKPGYSPSYTQEHILHRTFRSVPYAPPNHLRTFKAWLFKKIRAQDLLYDNKFLDVCYDVGMMFPMIEMCNGNFARINQVLYLYNVANPLCDFNIRLARQLYIDQYLRHQLPYMPITQAPTAQG